MNSNIPTWRGVLSAMLCTMVIGPASAFFGAAAVPAAAVLIFTGSASSVSAGPLTRDRAEMRRVSRRTSRRTARRTTRRLNVLPRGCRQVYMYGAPYYYYGNSYYEPVVSGGTTVYVEVVFD